MPYSAEHKARTREKILTSARRLFNRRGFSEVSIDEIMARAGLTRGGFYSHFDTKEQLYAEAIGHIFNDHPSQDWDQYNFCVEGGALARVVVESYLSDEHFENIETSCPLIALPSDTARSGEQVKAAYEHVLRAMAGVFEANIEERADTAQDRSLAIAALCVGGMVLARAINSRDMGDRIRAACRDLALETGGWDEEGQAADLGRPANGDGATARPLS